MKIFVITLFLALTANGRASAQPLVFGYSSITSVFLPLGIGKETGIYKKEGLKEAYRSFARVWEEVPYIRAESVQTILDLQPKDAVKNLTPDKYIDNSLVKELESSSFIKNLSRR